MDVNERLNKAIEARQFIETAQKSAKTEETTTAAYAVQNKLGSVFNPSEYLPIRTARYWADVEAGKLPDINFYKKLANGTYEIHNNATEGFEKVVNITALQQVLRETAFELSLTGESDIALFKQDKSIVPLKIQLVRKQYFPNGELMYYHGIVNFDTGTAPWILTKKFMYNDAKEVIMENIAYERSIDKSGETEEINWRELSTDKLEKKYGVNLAKSVNLGQVEFPVVTLTNTGADRWGAGTSDTAEVQDVLSRLDTVEDAIARSIKAAKLRLFNKRKNGSMDLLGANATSNSTARQVMDDVEILDIVEDPHTDSDGLQMTDRQLNADQWMTVRKSLLQEYYTHTGENVAADAHGNNQHTYEVQSKGDNKFRRATSKRTQRQAEIQSIVNIIISIAKTEGIQFFAGVDHIAVNVNEVDIRKEYEIEDKMEKLLSLGLVSKVQALMKIESIDEPTAIMLLANKAKHDKLFEEEKDDKQEVQEVSNEQPDVQDSVEQEEVQATIEEEK